VYTVFALYSPSYTLSPTSFPLPMVPTPPGRTYFALLFSSFIKEKKKEGKKWHFCLFKIATQEVSLWHFLVYMYYTLNWFMSIFLLFTLVPFLWWFQQV
jgi:hypothetical protein